MPRLPKLKAFTLIELIVVVIIIGVLAAIAAVAYNQFVSQARTTAAVADAKQVVTAVSAYGQQNDKVAADIFFDADLRAAALTTVSGDVVVGNPSANFSVVPPVVTVKVYAGANTSAKHFCTLDISGELPVLKKSTCQ